MGLSAKQIASAAGAIGASAAGVGAATGALLMMEARTARRRVEQHTPVDDPPTGNGVWGEGTGEPIVLAIMGDSSAVGLGVDDLTETPGVLIAAGLSRLSGRPVRLTRVAISGAESRHLDQQASDVLPEQPDVAVIMIGANDVTARTSPEVATAHLSKVVRRLRHAGVQVVVATCPDLGTVRPIPQPLRTIARKWSRDMAAAQIVAVIKAGGRTVALGSSLGPTFARYHELWSDDGFHPSAAGYAAAASVVLPSVADALGYWPISRTDIRDSALRRRNRSISQAALRSSQETGSQVTGAQETTLDGRRRDRARLRRLLPVPLPIPRRGPDRAAAPDLVADLSLDEALDLIEHPSTTHPSEGDVS
ncbi:SGNH/GDSL hydrolase family protein [Blastococcus sp. Marseille-P5729]|uniref:SGNH/GDSL hydrolase family protein n=1 Tax=Blastococcus sp. Marseille-P5729 TaxID=2086582 RepID=UPI0018FE0B1C|nr:SGNH/GDSL hydrolase family protein [Blastococcus sp. Marseille-P5729]